MPDLKTELTKVINQWNTNEEPTTMTTQPTQPAHPNVKNNVTRATFNHVRDNPGGTRSDAAAALIPLGFNASSVTSLIGQMVRQRLIREEDNKLFVNQKEYTPIKRKFPPLTKRVVKTKAAPRPKWTPPAPLPEPLPVLTVQPAPAPAEWSVESVIGSLNVRQAMAVYDELRKIFGA